MNIEAIRKRLEQVEPGQAIGPLEVELSAIRTDPMMQVRDRLDENNKKRLRSAYRSGAEVPPLLIAFVEGDEEWPVVIDGHHRFTVLEKLEAEAKVRGGEPVETVKAKIVKLSRAEARYQAAMANNTHGLQLKPRETRRVFAAYVGAGRHRNGDGFKSYREIGKDMSRDHKTISTWMKTDFPAEAAKMEKPEKATEGGEGPPPPLVLVKHEIEAWLLEGRNLFEQGRGGGRETIVEGMEKLLVAFKAQLGSAEWDGFIPGLDPEPSQADLRPDQDF